ncbi:dihydropteroate synthase [Ferrovibrio sp.]|uniref:dihydropteroate synthase n=1 Tax=Ferrovibrio sp. TaxID=1917215 RepID=UPI000CB40ADD|nr:dihydropteroate synthase [Ferrovibrio sp.]PJI42114.1 MAG: dihydropteroate synthase [Ferrovibrio sp.]
MQTNAQEAKRTSASSREAVERLNTLLRAADENGRPLVMGIVNVTDDSFSGDGLHGDPAAAIAQARAQVGAGADIIDLGAESTRPGAAPVPFQQEIQRLVPVIQALRREAPQALISVDTRNAATMHATAVSGAHLINDISALRGEGSLDAALRTGLPVVLMHMQGEPGSMQQAPQYDDVLREVRDFLGQRIAACRAAGMARDRILIDPGIGFGKTADHNLTLLQRLQALRALGYPLLVGVSRKSFIGTVAREPDAQRRLPGSISAALWAAQQGAKILRVHDVAETVQALDVWQAMTAGSLTVKKPNDSV